MNIDRALNKVMAAIELLKEAGTLLAEKTPRPEEGITENPNHYALRVIEHATEIQNSPHNPLRYTLAHVQQQLVQDLLRYKGASLVFHDAKLPLEPMAHPQQGVFIGQLPIQVQQAVPAKAE